MLISYKLYTRTKKCIKRESKRTIVFLYDLECSKVKFWTRRKRKCPSLIDLPSSRAISGIRIENFQMPTCYFRCGYHQGVPDGPIGQLENDLWTSSVALFRKFHGKKSYVQISYVLCKVMHAYSRMHNL